ncbi:MAG: coenzyme synthesis protein [Devosia sp.]|nr:coenzyme synthesis protein [Devosia sp.]
MIKIIILGAAAGGGVPQWNCGCANCRDARNDPTRGANQASAAVSADGKHWFLINASPDIRQQIAATPALHPAPDQVRHSPVAGVVLTNGEIDAVAGLLTLREGSPFALYAHPRVHAILAANTIFNALKPGVVRRVPMELGTSFSPALPDGSPSGLDIIPFAAPGKVALFLEDQDLPDPGDTLGLKIIDRTTGRSVVFLPACARLDDGVLAQLDGAEAVFLDGTLWRDDELIGQGLGLKTGQRMGHITMQDAIAALEAVRIGRKFFFHINNSNPAWKSGSPERQTMEAAGWTIPAQGTEITL